MSGIILLAGERDEKEPNRAIIACNDYLRLGSGRSLEKLCERYRAATEAPPTKRVKTLKDWSRTFDWQARAAVYDAAQDAAKTVEIERLRTEGLAADFERIRELDEIYRKLKEEFADKGLWYTDTKLSAKGDTVDVEVFNKPLLDTMRGVLDDLAKEVGGRKVEVKHGGSVETKNEQIIRHDLSKLSLDELLQLRSMVAKTTEHEAAESR